MRQLREHWIWLKVDGGHLVDAALALGLITFSTLWRR